MSHVETGYNVKDLDRMNGNSSSSDEFRDSDNDAHVTDVVEHDPGYTRRDRKDMERMGKKQELRRNFRIVSSVGFTSCVMGTWEILLTTNTAALTSGGSAGFFWSMCWVYVGQTFVVMSLAEMASMAPTAGGQYHWVSEFAPRSYQKFLSYISGWLSSLSWQTFFATNASICANTILAIVQLNNPTFVAERWHTTLLTWAFVVFVAMFNTFGAKRLPLAEGLFVTFHFFAFFPIIITLWVQAPKRTSSEVFLEFSDNGAGWPNLGWAVLVGQVSAMFTVLGSDSVAHMSEEIKDAAKIVPKSMWWAFLINIPFAFGILITYLYCLGDLEQAIASPYPFIFAFDQATSTGGATVLTVIILLLIFMIATSTFASTSRQTFAFARDHGFPFSSWVARVSPRWQIPLNAIYVTCAFTVLISLINIGSTVAFNALLSLGVVSLMSTYLISIGCVLTKRLRGHPLPPARWSLGKYGAFVNILGLMYATWAFFWAFWPTFYKPSLVDFNWACVIYGGVMVISLGFYAVHGHKVYDGPVVKVAGREFE